MPSALSSALVAREREPEKEAAIGSARHAVGKTLRTLGRARTRRSRCSRPPFGGCARRRAGLLAFREELAEESAAVARNHDAREQARLAIPLLEADEPSFADDEERRMRLASLAAET